MMYGAVLAASLAAPRARTAIPTAAGAVVDATLSPATTGSCRSKTRSQCSWASEEPDPREILGEILAPEEGAGAASAPGPSCPAWTSSPCSAQTTWMTSMRCTCPAAKPASSKHAIVKPAHQGRAWTLSASGWTGRTVLGELALPRGAVNRCTECEDFEYEAQTTTPAGPDWQLGNRDEWGLAISRRGSQRLWS